MSPEVKQERKTPLAVVRLSRCCNHSWLLQGTNKKATTEKFEEWRFKYPIISTGVPFDEACNG